MNKTAIIGLLIVVVLIVIGVWASQTPMPEHVPATTTMEEKEGPNTEDTMMEEEAGVEEGDAMVAMTVSGSYEEYAPEKLARAEDGDVVLFFHANWCPTCRSADKDISENAESIPPELTILKTNYDTEGALKQKYGVRYQHTFVQVDKDGNMIRMWSGSPTLAAIVGEVQ